MIGNVIRKGTQGVADFLELESAGGVLLVAVGALALIRGNSPLRHAYVDLLKTPLQASFAITKPLLPWIDDGLMAILLLLTGRKLIEAELPAPEQIVLPVCRLDRSRWFRISHATQARRERAPQLTNRSLDGRRAS